MFLASPRFASPSNTLPLLAQPHVFTVDVVKLLSLLCLSIIPHATIQLLRLALRVLFFYWEKLPTHLLREREAG